MYDGIPEGAATAGERVVSGFFGKIEVAVGGDGVVVLVVVGLDGGAGQFDEGVGVVEKAGADGCVIDPGGGGKAA